LGVSFRHIDSIMRTQELRRITKAGGKILIYVWAAEQDKFKNKGTDNGDLFVPWHLQKYVARHAVCGKPRSTRKRRKQIIFHMAH
jgi:hypothetical protein